jgi:hypothetical protein
MFLPGNKSALRIGSGNGSTGTQKFNKGSADAITQDLNTALFNNDTTIPLVIDLQGRAKPTDAIQFKTGLACPIATRFTNDKAAAFEFRKGTGTDRSNLIAHQVQLTGGKPNKNDVLVGDANGNARWAKASVVNGVVQFSADSVSPVIEGQECIPSQSCPTGTTGTYPNCTPNPVVTCNDPSAINYNESGMCTYVQNMCGGVLEKINYNNGTTGQNYTPNAKLYYKATAQVQDRCKVILNGESIPSGYILASQSQGLDNGECVWFDKTPYIDPTYGDLHTFSSVDECV